MGHPKKPASSPPVKPRARSVPKPTVSKTNAARTEPKRTEAPDNRTNTLSNGEERDKMLIIGAAIFGVVIFGCVLFRSCHQSDSSHHHHHRRNFYRDHFDEKPDPKSHREEDHY